MKRLATWLFQSAVPGPKRSKAATFKFALTEQTTHRQNTQFYPLCEVVQESHEEAFTLVIIIPKVKECLALCRGNHYIFHRGR